MRTATVSDWRGANLWSRAEPVASAMPSPGWRPGRRGRGAPGPRAASVEGAAAKLRGEVSGAEVLTEICDVSSYEQVSAAAQALEARWGRTDILVNNAGIAHHAPAETMSVAEWDRMLRVNLSGVFYCSQVFGIPMIARARAPSSTSPRCRASSSTAPNPRWPTTCPRRA